MEIIKVPGLQMLLPVSGNKISFPSQTNPANSFSPLKHRHSHLTLLLTLILRTKPSLLPTHSLLPATIVFLSLTFSLHLAHFLFLCPSLNLSIAHICCRSPSTSTTVAFAHVAHFLSLVTIKQVWGLIACANTGSPNTNGSQFFMTLDHCDWLDKKNTIFGKVTGDSIYNLLRIGEVETDQDDQPVDPAPKITSIEVIWNPFEDIVPRELFKKLPQPVTDKENKDVKKKALKIQMISRMQRIYNCP